MKQAEIPTIIEVANNYGVDPLFVAAIRLQENGAEGREYGVLSESAPTYDDQLRTTCVTVRNRILEYNKDNDDLFVLGDGGKVGRVEYSLFFIQQFGAKWAPLGARNDPNNLNKNWIPGVYKVYRTMCRLGHISTFEGGIVM